MVEEDVVLRYGQEETAIAAFYVTDKIDQCHVGFLPRHFVPYAPSCDGVLVQVTEVHSPTSKSVSKRKKFRHNIMGCCLATLITELPAWAAQANTITSAFLTKIEKEECDDDDHTTGRTSWCCRMCGI